MNAPKLMHGCMIIAGRLGRSIRCSPIRGRDDNGNVVQCASRLSNVTHADEIDRDTRGILPE